MTSDAVTVGAWQRPAFGVLVVAWGANMFASVLQTYRGELSQVQVTSLYGAYALGLIPALLIMAKVSDRLGRRLALTAGLVLSVAGTLLILASGSAFGGILAGRIVIGISAGAALAPATAWIKELSDAAGFGSSGARRAATALTGGFALGPLLSGIIVQWLPSPRPTAYLIHMALAGAGLFFLHGTPSAAEGAAREENSSSELSEFLTSRLFLGAIASTAPWVFGAATTSLAALPVLVSLGSYKPVGSGVLAALTLGTGILIQPLAQRLALRSPALPFRVAQGAVVTGMLVAALAAATEWVPLLFVTALILGSAYGLLLVSGLKLVQAVAPAQHAAMATAVFYALTYVGFAAPVIIPALGGIWSPAAVLVGMAVLGLVSLAATFVAWPRRVSELELS